jgi:mono/diheme cytochrome c family protein
MRRADLVFVLVFIAWLVGVITVAGCGEKRRGELVGRPIIADTPQEKRGERLFYRYCSYCHPGGEAGVGPALNDKPLPESLVRAQVRRGLGAMPAFEAITLSDEQVADVAAFVSDLRQTTVAQR